MFNSNKLNKMVSIDLDASSPTPSLSGVYKTKPISKPPESAAKFRLRAIENDLTIYEKYFHKRIVKPVAIAQFVLAAGILICQLCTTALLIKPETESSALSTSDRIGIGIWTTVMTTFAAGTTVWAMNKPNFCKLQTTMMLHLIGLVAYIVLEYFVLMNTIPNIQSTIYGLQQKMPGETLESVRGIITSEELRRKNSEAHVQAELDRLYASLVLSVIMALVGILQSLLHLFMVIKTTRAICLGKTYLEGRMLQMQTLGSTWRTRSSKFGFGAADSKDHIVEDKLERSDALPPPPYESGYFQQTY